MGLKVPWYLYTHDLIPYRLAEMLREAKQNGKGNVKLGCWGGREYFRETYADYELVSLYDFN